MQDKGWGRGAIKCKSKAPWESLWQWRNMHPGTVLRAGHRGWGVQRTPSGEWKDSIFSNYISDKGLVFWVYKEPLQLNDIRTNSCHFCSVVFNSFVTPWSVVHQAPLPMGLPRQEYWMSCHFLLQGIFLTQELNPHLLHFQDSLQWATRETP